MSGISGSNARQPGQQPPEDRQSLALAVAYIDNHLGGHITNADLAHAACVGQTKLKSIFHDAFGMTPGAYLTAARVAQAKKLLAETDLPIASIAAQVGYRKPGAFSAAFKRHEGVAPSAFRSE